MKNPFKKQRAEAGAAFDPALYTPVIRASICTGERVAGFRGPDGRIHEVLLLRSEKDLDAFRARYGVRGDIETVY